MSASATPCLRAESWISTRLMYYENGGLVIPPERAPLAACFRDVHASDRLGLERLGIVLDPVDQLHLGLGGQHDLAVDACGQTTGVALGHPPHAHQSVGAGAEHQPLQPADLREVPGLRRREDPLAQPPYLSL